MYLETVKQITDVENEMEQAKAAARAQVQQQLAEAEKAGKELLQQVWINLLDNAIKFSPECGTVTVMIREQPDILEVTISNQGPQIPKEKFGRIFDKFYQGDESPSTEGNGIGLTIVGRILVLCGGTITVDSTPGEGSTFTVSLPLISKT